MQMDREEKSTPSRRQCRRATAGRLCTPCCGPTRGRPVPQAPSRQAPYRHGLLHALAALPGRKGGGKLKRMSPVPAAKGSLRADPAPPHPAPGLGTLAVLIPAWQPDSRLVDLVQALAAAGFGRLLVVDDGSRDECAPVSSAVCAIDRAVVLRHARNLGKGRALKTGFGHLLRPSGDSNEWAGVVTADADGQHTPEDIVRVGETLLGAGGRPVLGVRSFTGDVPRRSRVGNAVARRVFASLTGTDITDTQTGLRGLPRAVLPELLQLRGERYDYELTMLAHLCRTGPPPAQLPIATVYLDGNRQSHFNPLWDSLRVVRAVLRLCVSTRGR